MINITMQVNVENLDKESHRFWTLDQSSIDI